MIQRTRLCREGEELFVLSLSEDGFCHGVRRALARTRETAEGDGRPVITLGDIVHNPRVVADLRERGIEAVDAACRVPEGSVVVVRSHGVAPQVMDELRARGAEVVDATCPRVRRVQRAAQKYRDRGLPIVIIGYRDHPEVRGVVGHCGADAEVVESPLGADALPRAGERAVLLQTTFDPERGEAVIEALRRVTEHLTVEETLCQVVSERRRAVQELAAQADCLVIVGGKDSSNTSSLVEIGRRAGIATVHVETPDELSLQDFRGGKTVAVAGGTSTPEKDIREAEAKIIRLLSSSTGD